MKKQTLKEKFIQIGGHRLNESAWKTNKTDEQIIFEGIVKLTGEVVKNQLRGKVSENVINEAFPPGALPLSVVRHGIAQAQDAQDQPDLDTSTLSDDDIETIKTDYGLHPNTIGDKETGFQSVEPGAPIGPRGKVPGIDIGTLKRILRFIGGRFGR